MKGTFKHVMAALSLLFAVSILMTSCLNPRVPDKGMNGVLVDDSDGQETVMHEPNDSILPGDQGWDTDVLFGDETDSMISGYRATTYELMGVMEHLDNDLDRARISASPTAAPSPSVRWRKTAAPP